MEAHGAVQVSDVKAHSAVQVSGMSMPLCSHCHPSTKYQQNCGKSVSTVGPLCNKYFDPLSVTWVKYCKYPPKHVVLPSKQGQNMAQDIPNNCLHLYRIGMN